MTICTGEKRGGGGGGGGVEGRIWSVIDLLLL